MRDSRRVPGFLIAILLVGAVVVVAAVLLYVCLLSGSRHSGPGWDFLGEPELGLSQTVVQSRFGQPLRVDKVWQCELTPRISLFLIGQAGPDAKAGRVGHSFIRAVDGTGFWEVYRSDEWVGRVADTHALLEDLRGLTFHEAWQRLGTQGVSRTRWTYELPVRDWTQYMDVLFDEHGRVVGALSRTDS